MGRWKAASSFRDGVSAKLRGQYYPGGEMYRIFCACLFGVFVVAVSSGTAEAACTAIGQPSDFAKIRNNLGGQFCLTQDIDMSSVANFPPIGNDSNPFTGSLDGKGFVIRNLTIKTPLFEVGLFAALGGNGVVRNLGLVNAEVRATSNSSLVGAIAGRMRDTSKVVDCFVSGLVRAADSSWVGGMVVRKDSGEILRSHSAAIVLAGQLNLIGGLLGEQSAGKVSFSSSSVPVTATDGNRLGGLIGNSQNDTTSVEYSSATGPVTGGANNSMGGLIGKNDAPVRFSYSL